MWGNFKEKVDEIPEAEIKIGALKFSSGVQWVTKSGFVSLEDFYWNDVQADGVTNLGEALKELDSKLSRNAYLVSETGYLLPVIIFLSDGGPCDDWKKAFENANKNNKWFQKARKIAVAIGDDADKDVLQKLVGTREAVVQANDLETLKSLIVAISVSAAMLGSISGPHGDAANGLVILKDALKNVEGDVKVEKDINIPVTSNTDTVTDVDGGGDWGDNDWNQGVVQSSTEDMVMPTVEGIIPKKLLPVIFVIDTSGGMAGDSTVAVNEAMLECEEILKEKASEIPEAEIKIGVQRFSSGVQWVTESGLVPLEDFY